MDNIQQLIEQAKAVMTCPSCGRHYGQDEIKFKGFMDHTYILQTTCTNQHPTIFTTWITSYAPTTASDLLDLTPIETDHVIALHDALKQFDGNFKALWSSKGM